jgi:MerR family transcriptional regulator, light-induced transcriptional regulator
MLDNIKSTFSISDLHNLSGVSAHTIRIWERRFELLKPERTATNIRLYNNEHLKKLLNISLLVKKGYKISELAALNDQQLVSLVNSTIAGEENWQRSIDSFKVAMIDFNTHLFNDTYSRLLSEMSFYDMFVRVMIPFLEQIGQLWQTNSITIAHEHFISNLLRQKLFFNIDKLPRINHSDVKRYVLYLPIQELHELGLLFLHYVLLLSGRDSVYLGQDVSVDALTPFVRKGSNVTFISFLTIVPQDDTLSDYLAECRNKILQSENELWLTGSRLDKYKKNKSWSNISIFPDVRVLLNKIRQ